MAAATAALGRALYCKLELEIERKEEPEKKQ
jgi:hypothetical protein